MPPENSRTGCAPCPAGPAGPAGPGPRRGHKPGPAQTGDCHRRRCSSSRSSWNTAVSRFPASPSTVPLSGRSSPSRMRSRVVLPVPEGAMTAVMPGPAKGQVPQHRPAPRRICTGASPQSPSAARLSLRRPPGGGTAARISPIPSRSPPSRRRGLRSGSTPWRCTAPRR